MMVSMTISNLDSRKVEDLNMGSHYPFISDQGSTINDESTPVLWKRGAHRHWKAEGAAERLAALYADVPCWNSA